jgi:uncharacterized protein YndB with AHSA1/START domain
MRIQHPPDICGQKQRQKPRERRKEFVSLAELVEVLGIEGQSVKRDVMMSDVPKFVLDREFDAPCELVWRTWTEEVLLARWYGPGVETVIHELDVRAGGMWRNEMRMQGRSSYEVMKYTQVVPSERLVWLQSMTDEAWNVIANPWMANWPQVLLTTVSFEERDGHTHLRLVWEPHEANDAEIAGFAEALGGLSRGWGKGMDVLAEMLVELQQ